MVIFLYGPDDYRVNQKLKEIVAEYQKKYGGSLGLTNFDLQERTGFEEMKRFFDISSIFASGKLAVAENVFQSPHLKNIEDFLKKSDILKNKENFLIIIEGDIQELKENKKKFANFLLKKPVCHQAFNFFKNYQEARSWLRQETKKRNIEIEEAALQFLFESFPRDNRRLIKELEKIALYKLNEKIKKEDVFAIASLETSPHFFQIFDSFFEQNKKKTIFYFEEAVKAGLDPALIFNFFVNQIRGAVYLLFDQSKEIELHPYVIRKIQNQLWRWRARGDKLMKIYRDLARVDFQVKTGKIDYASALEKIIVNL